MTTPQGVAIVTGASQGLGRAIALRLAQDGYSVAINDIPDKVDAVTALVEEICRSAKVRAIAAIGDVTEEEDVKSLIAKTVAELGDLTVVSSLPVRFSETDIQSLLN
jgi:meso-butanediol dehydrogenase / (S,S)-butanediol dehydrogenase / diacetyl reductase